MTNPDVLILGAGMAGLTAARTLAQAGLRVLVLEAQQRVGGRILTERAHGKTIELGAEFVHGRPQELLDLIHEAGLTLYERTGQQISAEGTHLVPQSLEDRQETFDPLEALKHLTGPDLSFTAYLDRRNIHGEARTSAIGYVEGFNAADAMVASAAALGRQQQVEDAADGDRAFKIREGYDRLPQFLAAELTRLSADLRLSTPVTAIEWQPGHVTLTTPAGPLHAPRCLITLPLGVLHANSVPFTPSLPPATTSALHGLRMGPVARFTLVFRRPFWHHLEPQPDMQHLSFLFASDRTPSVWWTSHPSPAPTLTGWVGGPRSLPLLAQSPDALAREACTSLAGIFDLEPAWVLEQLLSCHTHNWSADPHALGAYSYVAVDGLTASHTLSQPIADTLFLAGEHTDTTGNWGTVHAALRSGLRAAHQILHPGQHTWPGEIDPTKDPPPPG